MHIEFLVEEPSAEAAIRIITPRIVALGTTFDIHVHNGKSDLLRKLPGRLRGYSHWLPSDWRIVVLIDEDRQDCRMLKQQLEVCAANAALLTRAVAKTPDRIQVVTRIAVEELEAWFFGDVQALQAAYPGIPASLDQKQEYRDPDRIMGGTWEALERVLQAAGYQQGGLAKIQTARAVANHMDPARNKSKSFQMFRDALATLAL